MAARIYNKLDTYLKREFDADTFERIRHRDSCIVCSKKEDKAFKFVLLSDEWIYLTENPPVTVTKELQVKDIVTVKLIDKKPEFLQGKEQNEVQHIEIVYQTNTPQSVKNTDKAKSKKANKAKASLLTSSRSDSVLMRTDRDRKHVHFTRKNSLDELETDDFKTLQKKKYKQRKKKRGTKRGDSIEEEGEQEGLAIYLPSSQEDLNQSDSNPDLTSSRSTSSLKNFFSFKKPLTEEDELARTGTPVYIGNDIIFVQDDDRDDEAPLKVTEVFNIYILDQYSPFLRYVKAAVQNHHIEATLKEDRAVASQKELCIDNASVKTPRTGTSEKLEMLYNQLRREILDPNNTILNNFHLVRELRSAAEKMYFLKKVFWRATEVPNFLLKELHFYIPTSRSLILDSDMAERAKRADELEYSILICETLKTMMRGTEILNFRSKVLLEGGAIKVRSLLTALTQLPEIPGGYDDAFFNLDIRRERSATNITQDSKPWNSTLLNLAHDFVAVSISLLFEIFTFAQQANDSYPDFTVDWCTSVLEGKDSTGELLVLPFLTLTLNHLLKLFIPSKRNESLLNPKQHVDLFYKMVFLCSVVRGSRVLLQAVQDQFFEEFQYYLKPPLVKKRLCKDYALYVKIVSGFTELVSIVLQKDVVYH